MASVIQAGTASNTALTLSSDTSGELQLKTNSGSTTAMTLTTAGNVGIGTTSPTYTLEVARGTSGQQSIANFRTADSTAANNAGLQIFATPSATAASRNVIAVWDADGADASGADYFYIQKVGNSGNVEIAQYSNAAIIFSTNVGTERMRITSGGDVGIGTTTPGAPLQVRGTNTLVANTRYLKGWIGGAGSWDTNSYEELGVGFSGIRSIYTGGTNWDLTFATGTSAQFVAGTQAERMRITGSGNVGIGTSSPSVRLELSCSQASSTFPIISNNTSNIATSINGIHFPMSNGSSGAQIYIRSDVSGGDYTMTIANGQNQPIRFCTSATTERMRITGDGLVGIGNSSPTYTLDVTGSIRASTYLYASGSAAGHGLYLANGSSNGLISQMSNGSASTVTYIGNQTITTSSDIRIKNNVRPTERNALELLSQWEIVDHNWNDPSDQCENNKNSRGVWTGVIAQQIQPITPWLVNKPLEDENKDGSKNLWLVDFAYSVPLLVKAIQEQQAQIEELKQEVAKLKGV